MPTNPTSTLSAYELKKYSGYIKATHEKNEYFYIVDKEGNDFLFSRENGLLIIINGLDYVPIIHPVEHSPICCQGGIRRSSRVPKPSFKMKAYLQEKHEEVWLFFGWNSAPPPHISACISTPAAVECHRKF